MCSHWSQCRKTCTGAQPSVKIVFFMESSVMARQDNPATVLAKPVTRLKHQTQQSLSRVHLAFATGCGLHGTLLALDEFARWRVDATSGAVDDSCTLRKWQAASCPQPSASYLEKRAKVQGFSQKIGHKSFNRYPKVQHTLAQGVKLMFHFTGPQLVKMFELCHLPTDFKHCFLRALLSSLFLAIEASVLLSCWPDASSQIYHEHIVETTRQKLSVIKRTKKTFEMTQAPYASLKNRNRNHTNSYRIHSLKWKRL